MTVRGEGNSGVNRKRLGRKGSEPSDAEKMRSLLGVIPATGCTNPACARDRANILDRAAALSARYEERLRNQAGIIDRLMKRAEGEVVLEREQVIPVADGFTHTIGLDCPCSPDVVEIRGDRGIVSQKVVHLRQDKG